MKWMLRLMNTELFRRVEIQLLMNLTARALGTRSRFLALMPSAKSLRMYAEYTAHHLAHGASELQLQRMHAEAYQMGRCLRHCLFLHRQKDVEQVLWALYRNIGIRVSGHIPGSICFGPCFFSHYYTPQVCLAASALDEGIMCGLSGNGHLRFKHRITEGAGSCGATLNDK